MASALRHIQVLAKLDQTFNQISKHIVVVVVSNAMRKIYLRAPHGQIDVNYFLRKILLTDLISLNTFHFLGYSKVTSESTFHQFYAAQKAKGARDNFCLFILCFLFSFLLFGLECA